MEIRPIIHTCKSCEHENIIIINDRVNILDNYGLRLKRAILTDRFFGYHCESCGEWNDTIYPCLYHDPEKEIIIWMVPEMRGQEKIISAIKKLKPVREKYTQRIVKTPRQLAEKISIFDFGLNDKVVEFCKATSFSDFCTQSEKYHDAILINSMLIKDPAGDLIMKYDVLVDGKMDTFRILMDNPEYMRAKRELMAICDDMDSPLFQIIDHSWVMGLLSNTINNSPES